ncbi:MAG TPA: RHS repeat-associated core domain-containing protein [Anaerohalosphaeraceae bacterium]|nr:RHS repeat-associated core domain-containing protein [Anaerohalosphaeraceae bacterium]
MKWPTDFVCGGIGGFSGLNSSVDVDNVDLSCDKVTDTVYDVYGRLYRQRSYFDGANQRISLKEYSYDGHSRIGSVEFCELEEVEFLGQIWEGKFPLKVMTYQYNAKGQRVQQTLTNVNTRTGQAVDVDSYYWYDSQGRLIQIQNAQGVIFDCKYDALGRKTEETDATGKVTRYVYNPLGRLADMAEDPAGLNRQTSYEYDRSGRQTAIVSGSDRTDYAYNYLGEIADVNYPSGDSISFGYDMLGEVIRRTATKNGQSMTTHYKRNALGRVCYKQYTDEPEWSEPNSLLPFDEVLYDAMGNKHIIAAIDGEDDLELNLYSYDYFGNLTGAAETFGDFSSSVSYGYDQRGLLTSITYPDEKTVAYTRDALGRIDSVTYDGKTLVEYGYLGDTVISKTLAHIEYTAAVDTLGRVTGETFTAISTGTPFMTHSYDYTGHSNRLDERNGIDYTFDGLGKLTAEDSTSYTSDILGNPTNAPAGGLTYGLDDEDRIVDVDDGGGVFAEYGYDRLGRRARKTADGVGVNFVYDLFGNVIAEYEDGSWSRDYVYGAAGEVVYMRCPQTSEMNDALENLVDFAEAWLCCPDCTIEQLVWDVNEDDQVNLIDWTAAVEANNFDGAFLINGYYLLTDFRNSVIGKVNPGGSVDEISYDAWGIPYVSQGVDLEGLSILWNGYYYDMESGNYYLRNRYYSPLERRFLTEDPHGINPDENWNNPFDIQRQYSDGCGLQVYAQGDPVNNRDAWGLWKYALPVAQRTKEGRTFVIANDVWEMKYNIKGLAQLVRLNEEQFDDWGKRAIREVNGIKKCGAWVPNTAYVDRGEISYIGSIPNPWLITETNNIKNHFLSEGYSTIVTTNVDGSCIDAHLSSGNIIAWGVVAHGVDGAEGTIMLSQDEGYTIHDAKRVIHHKLSEVILFVCWGRQGRWEGIRSRYGTLRASNASFSCWHDWDDLPTE